MIKSIKYVVVTGFNYLDEEETVLIPIDEFRALRDEIAEYQSRSNTQYMYSPSDCAISELTGFNIAQCWSVRHHHVFGAA